MKIVMIAPGVFLDTSLVGKLIQTHTIPESGGVLIETTVFDHSCTNVIYTVKSHKTPLSSDSDPNAHKRMNHFHEQIVESIRSSQDAIEFPK
jgi:hypothetical protein